MRRLRCLRGAAGGAAVNAIGAASSTGLNVRPEASGTGANDPISRGIPAITS